MKLIEVVQRHVPLSVKHLWRQLRYRPLKNMGPSSYIHTPVAYEHGDCISIGARSLVRSRARFMPLKEYAGHVLHSSIQIGDDVYIGTDAFLVSGCGITIGNGCVLSDQVYINDTHHGLDPTKGPILSQPMETKGPIVIEEGCFIGYRAIVLSGVTLGHHCVVGAGAVVTKSFPPYSAIGGVPARLLRTTTDEVQAIGA